MSDGIPLVPDPDEARGWVQQELSDPAYAQAQPTPLDRWARGVSDAIGRLFQGEGGEVWGPLLAVIAVVVVLAVVVVAVLIWGRPRAVARAERASAPLFGEDTARSAEWLRTAAEEAAARGDWDAAIAARLRAVARGLDDRGVVETGPGDTVHRFARLAGSVFPDQAARLEAAASDFDDVRYLRRPGSRAAYLELCALDDALSVAPVGTP